MTRHDGHLLNRQEGDHLDEVGVAFYEEGGIMHVQLNVT
jgi:hypothetical protein